MMTFSILLTTSVVTNHRALTESDVHFPLHDFHREFYTRATRSSATTLTSGSVCLTTRSPAPGQLQTFLVTPAAGVQPGTRCAKRLRRAPRWRSTAPPWAGIS